LIAAGIDFDALDISRPPDATIASTAGDPPVEGKPQLPKFQVE
jgi:hypothetical protein